MDGHANVTEGITPEGGRRSGHAHGHVVRRRRARTAPSTRQWVAARSKRRVLRTAAVCTGVLLLMALGLYFGLSRQDSASPVGGSERGGVTGPRGVV
jgi:hypothetical protein